MMLSFLFAFFVCGPAQAESLRMPPEMRAEWGKAKLAVIEGLRKVENQAREGSQRVADSPVGRSLGRRLRAAGESPAGKGLLDRARGIWGELKGAVGRMAAGIDRRYHEQLQPAPLPADASGAAP